MLTTIGTRIARPTAQVVRKLKGPTRIRFTTRAANLDEKVARRSRNDRQLADTRPGMIRRPVSLATDLFFPGQVGSLFREMEDEIARLWGNESQKLAQNSPLAAVDIKETKDAYVFSFDAPGLTKSDVNVRITPDGILAISGERSWADESDDASGFHRVERTYGKFQRRFALPENVEAGSIQAKVAKGELTVVVPKKDVAKKETTEIPVTDTDDLGAEAGEKTA